MRLTHLLIATAAMSALSACVSLSSSRPNDPPSNTTVVVPQHSTDSRTEYHGCPAGVDDPC